MSILLAIPSVIGQIAGGVMLSGYAAEPMVFVHYADLIRGWLHLIQLSALVAGAIRLDRIE